MGEVFAILREVGPWGAPFVLGWYAYQKRLIATGRELKQVEDALAELRAERDKERTELRQEIVFWRDIAWSNSRIADQVVGALPVRKGRA